MKIHPLLFLLALSSALLPAAETTSPVAPAPFPFAEATIEQLQGRMSAGTLTAHALTAAYLARIAALDRAGPGLNAVIEINPDALALAEQLDGERAAGKVRGPLHGIPVLLKDNIATADHTNATYDAFGGAPVDASGPQPRYANDQNWDASTYALPATAVRIEVRLKYQTASKEYIEFLRDENTTNTKGQFMYDKWAENGAFRLSCG